MTAVKVKRYCDVTMTDVAYTQRRLDKAVCPGCQKPLPVEDRDHIAMELRDRKQIRYEKRILAILRKETL